MIVFVRGGGPIGRFRQHPGMFRFDFTYESEISSFTTLFIDAFMKFVKISEERLEDMESLARRLN